MAKFEDLEFERVIAPELFKFIPRYLFEQVKELDSDAIDRIVKYGSSILTTIVPTAAGFIRAPNPLVWVVVMFDVAQKIKGFLWADIDVVEKHIFVQVCSVDREYQSAGGGVERRVAEYLFNLPIDDEYKHKLVMATMRPSKFKKYGWHQSKRILLEITNGHDPEQGE